MNEKVTPGERLRAVRVGLGLEQAHVAHALGVNAAVVSRHEHGRRGIAEETALRYAKYYGVPVDFLLCRDKPADPIVATATVSKQKPRTRGDRLRELRLARGYVKLAPTARMIGVNPTTMTHHEKGLREITRRQAEIYGAFFRVPASFILFGDDLPAQNLVPIVGRIIAGGRVEEMPTTDNEIKRVAVPAAQNQELEAYAVTGDELYPAYFPGDVVFCAKGTGRGGKIERLEINDRECIVITASGDKQIRVVKAEPNERYSLFGPHAPPQFHVRLRAAWPVVQINRGMLRAAPRAHS
jgi:transcriptional regulator with XRE-family HTH domain